jgi:hypothetical protein
MMKTKIKNLSYFPLALVAAGLLMLVNSCSDSAASPSIQQPPAPSQLLTRNIRHLLKEK